MVIGVVVAMASQELAAWVFGGGLLILLGVMAVTKRNQIPPFQEQILSLFGALLAGLLAFFITGTIAVEAKGIQAMGGLAMFVLVRFGWRVKIEVTPLPESPDSAGARLITALLTRKKLKLKLKRKPKRPGLSTASVTTMEIVTLVIGGLLVETTAPAIDWTRRNLAIASGLGKDPGDGDSLLVMEQYHPSGLMGDIGDINDGVVRGVGIDRFVFEAKGRGPHEWELKYVNGKINNAPAKFAGVMYLDPPGNFGEVYGGFDLQRVRGVLMWEGRSAGEDVAVEFVAGGIDWMWDERDKKRIKPRYADSMRGVRLGMKKLTKDWQPFEYPISRVPKDNFRRVVGAFGWVINWGSNGVRTKEDGTGPEEVKTFTIELRNIRYERR